MSSTSKQVGLVAACGEELGEASAITVKLDFKPSIVHIINQTTEVEYWWNQKMTNGYAYKSILTPTGSQANGTAAAQIWTVGTATGTNGTSAVTGTGTFVGTSSGSLDLATPAFSGTGFATAGQVVTTTDNQTMTLNECAGMWLIADALTTTAPVLIVSNTAVSGAPAVLTVIGTAPVTDAGTYKIVKNIVPTGSVTALSGTAAAQTWTVDTLTGTNGTSVVTPGAFTGGSGDAVLLTSNGITPGSQGFIMGTSIQTTNDVVSWEAWR